MRSEMDRIRILTDRLEKTTDPLEREAIQDEIWELEDQMNTFDSNQYKTFHGKYYEN